MILELTMRNIKVTIAYDGTNYHGFQEQRGTKLNTIQGVLEECLSALAKKPVQVIGAGRTDAGVHAGGQVINFMSDDWPVPVDRVTSALNSILPRDIVTLSAEEVPANFHARFSAVAKSYRYTIYNGKWHSPFMRLYSYHIPKLLDLPAMQKAASNLLGKHDFSAFRALGTPVRTTVRKLYQIQLTRSADLIYIDLLAEGFLYHMARMISGTLIRVGLGKITPDEVSDILASRDSHRGGPAAPARGLSLEKVYYPPALD
ncbi:MAG: tRNA pseudouridine(38-40) synthase TruA [Desulfotomaculaceae bacterium]|nr:tRNA pseudouridine(38-40) synthase TruA [Desulfotomaculaceae bacterium]